MDQADGNGAGERVEALARFARLAAATAGVPMAVAGVGDGIAYVGLDAERARAALAACPDRHGLSERAAIDVPSLVDIRFAVWMPAPGGALCVLDTQPRSLGPAQIGALHDVASLIAADAERDARHDRLQGTIDRALRSDRLLRLVSGAATTAEALAAVLGEICSHHGATVGRIWQLNMPEQTMQEVSRFNAETLDAKSYYQRPPDQPISSYNMIVAEAISSNEPRAVNYSQVPNPERYTLLAAATASGLRSQVSYPIWVQDQRFGVSIAFSRERDDLATVEADIASLANIIRPALFRKVTEERIRHIAHHDDLTQLATRLVFQDQLNEAVAAAHRGQQGLALLYLDLDGFKLVNDTRGHDVGDRLLTAVAGRLRDSVRAGDTIARMGGDEFAVVQALDGVPAAAIRLADRLVDRISQPYDIGGARVLISVSIGVAVFPTGGDTPEVLLRNADTALYRAKEAGRNTYRKFEPAMDVRRQERALFERELGEAIDRQQFTLAYQPICDTNTLKVRGFEALLRWQHPVRGPVAPEHFVRLAEASGLILPLGRWALETACAEAATWSEDVRLSVNLSPLQFRQPDLPEQIAEILERSGLPGSRLDLEVTEGLLLDDSGVVLRTMQALKAQGACITLDDFGTAYASLSYLRRFPFDRIKIDRSFVQAMCDDDVTLAIVQAIMQLCTRLRLDVVAEGVETMQELETLRRLECHLVQGFLTGAPMPDRAAGALFRAEKVEVAPLIGLQDVAKI